MRSSPLAIVVAILIGIAAAALAPTAGRAGEDGASPKPVPWGRIGAVELSAPLAGMDLPALLAASLGAMPTDLVLDGLPWFGAARDDFLNIPRRHQGLDFYGSDLAVTAMADGVVTARSSERRAGYFVVIDHGGGVVTRYMHLDRPYAGPDRVKRGDIIGTTGRSGNAVSPQLHLEVTRDGRPIDPIAPLLSAAGEQTIALVKSYRSRMPVKTEARDHLVRARLAPDRKTGDEEERKALDLLSTIADDPAVARWLSAFGAPDR
jgi:hypothetical protein